jgi:hypothetical protein
VQRNVQYLVVSRTSNPAGEKMRFDFGQDIRPIKCRMLIKMDSEVLIAASLLLVDRFSPLNILLHLDHVTRLYQTTFRPCKDS